MASITSTGTRAGTTYTTPTHDLGLLVGRILIALLFIPAGFGKLMGFAGTVGYITSVGLPLPQVAAAIAVLVELGVGILFLVGFGAFTAHHFGEWKFFLPGAALQIWTIVMGVLTSTFGGVIRDVLAHQPSVLLRRELYVTPALLGAVVFVGLDMLQVPTVLAGIMGFLAAFALRAGAILFGWQMRGFPGRAE